MKIGANGTLIENGGLRRPSNRVVGNEYMTMNNRSPHRAASRSITPLALAIMAALAPCGVPLAQQAPVVPDPGTLLQQLKPNKPPAPSSSATGLTLEQPNGTALPAGAAFPVKHLEIQGNTRFDAQTLHSLVADGEGKEPNLAQIPLGLLGSLRFS